MRNLYYLPFPLPDGGLAFWIMTGIFSVTAIGITLFLVWLAFDNLDHPLKLLPCALALGVCHALWYASTVVVLLQLLDQILELIVMILFIGFLVIFAAGFGGKNTKYKEVLTTTRVYNDIGNLVDIKYDVDYVEVPEEEKK